MNMQNILLSTIFFLMCSSLCAQNGNILIKNGTVITITDGVKENTDVLISNGKISQIGEGLQAGSNTRVIEAENMYVMPGIIDCP